MENKEEKQKNREHTEEEQTATNAADGSRGAGDRAAGEAEQQSGPVPGPEQSGNTATAGAGGADEQHPDEQLPGPELSEIDEMKAQIEQLSGESAMYKDKWLRAEADMDNYKKRIHKDRLEQLKYGYETLIRELLPVMDNLERAIEYSKKHSQADSLYEGVELTFKMLKRVVESFGVNTIETVGKMFDPSFHEGLGVEEADGYEDNIIIKEIEKGYIYNDRLLRPAKVIVGKKSVPEKVSE
ncbi:MAG: nucleotide exchange factor GrpE [Deltaproteobacteria bacterium]|nr:nucleotide exchange factor GrpE [Deltaproteobacteria bacterium]MCL5277151.1 nucleotide exchange factor GrpE [Deltaproteobacteria bacterium]